MSSWAYFIIIGRPNIITIALRRLLYLFDKDLE